MGLLDFFRRKKKTSAGHAKERLQILIAHERIDRCGPDYLPQLRHDLMLVIQKYVPISLESIQVQFEKGDMCDMLELNIELPED